MRVDIHSHTAPAQYVEAIRRDPKSMGCHIEKDDQGRRQLLECKPEQEEDQRHGEGHDEEKPVAGFDVMLELPAPFGSVSRGQLHLPLQRSAGLGDESDRVTARHVGFDGDSP